MKRDIVILKSTGKVAIIHPNMELRDGVVFRHTDATPGFQNSPFIEFHQHVFKIGVDYELIKNVEIPEEVMENKQRYMYDKKAGEFRMIDTYVSAGYDRAIRDLQTKVEALGK
jgi:hypothetical protein